MISTTLQGRLGNQFYQIAMMLAYCKKFNLSYYIPNLASHCDGSIAYFSYMSNGSPINLKEHHELIVHATPKGDGTYNYNTPLYQNISDIDNIKFVGYWQTFKYFDWCRNYILDKFNLPYSQCSMVGIHIRRGDFLQLIDKHPIVNMDYYKRAIEYFNKQGYRSFYIFSDDITWCKTAFSDPELSENYFEFSENNTEVKDLELLSNCEHQILCYSTFGFIAGWLNQNTDKQVIIPPERYCFSGANSDMIPSYFTQLEF